MSEENERKQIESIKSRLRIKCWASVLKKQDAFEETYYELEALKKSREDYSPYSYIEDSEDPVFFDEKILEEWDWE